MKKLVLEMYVRGQMSGHSASGSGGVTEARNDGGCVLGKHHAQEHREGRVLADAEDKNK